MTETRILEPVDGVWIPYRVNETRPPTVILWDCGYPTFARALAAVAGREVLGEIAPGIPLTGALRRRAMFAAARALSKGDE